MFVVKKDGQFEDVVLRTRGEASDTIEDRREEGVTEHANNEPAVIVDDGDTSDSLSAGINNSGSNENGGVEATQDIYQLSQVVTVRTSTS